MAVNSGNGFQVVEDFLRYWDRGGQMYYKDLADTVEATCRTFLTNSAFQYQIKSRAKSKERLAEKLVKRLKEDPRRYSSREDIERDIVDLAGVRIALYFPKHQKSVSQFLAQEYDIVQTIAHEGIQNGGEVDYQKRFRGYQATHFRARARSTTRALNESHTDMLEIQVMSVFQQVWAEVEHDILYKQLKGHPSLDERRMLDGLNGLVSMGDLHLEQLNDMYESRITSTQNKVNRFENEFEVGVILSSWLSRVATNITAGPVGTLFRFLKLPSVGLDTLEKLENLLASLQNDVNIPFVGVEPSTINASVVVMYHIVSSPPHNSLAELNENFRPDSSSQCCRVLISTIILLDELFPPLAVWEPRLTYCAFESNDDDRIASLAWLLGESAPRMAIMGECELDDEERTYVDVVWAWFSQHPSCIVKLVFGAAKIGLIRDSQQDISTLDRIWRVLHSILMPI